MRVTKREIIASISIVAIMLIVGIIISSKISDAIFDAQEKYSNAVKIESADIFKYGMETNVGDSFVYGEMKAVDAVTYPEIGGEYLSVTKVKERYTEHTRTVTTTDSEGNTITTTETYWTWDKVGEDSLIAERVVFCGNEFNYSQFNKQSEDYIKTIKESYYVRYKYYGCPKQLSGTIFAFLADGGLGESGAVFYRDMTIEKTVQHLNSNAGLVLFWFIWILLIISGMYGFYYLDNRWLEG